MPPLVKWIVIAGVILGGGYAIYKAIELNVATSTATADIENAQGKKSAYPKAASAIDAAIQTLQTDISSGDVKRIKTSDASLVSLLNALQQQRSDAGDTGRSPIGPATSGEVIGNSVPPAPQLGPDNSTPSSIPPAEPGVPVITQVPQRPQTGPTNAPSNCGVLGIGMPGENC